MVKSGTDIWFGTSANQFCTVLGTYLSTIQQMIGFQDFPLLTDSFVCEFGFSDFCKNFTPTNPHLPSLPKPLGDWRPPKIYVYNTQTKTRTDRTPADPLIQDTLGIRASGAMGNTLIMGGPNLIASFFQAQLADYAGINLFAFRADTGAYLGSKFFADYWDIRKWLVVGNHLYTAVRYKDGTGRVLKWTGNPASEDINEILKFEEVGILDAEGAELAYHDGRIFVTTWATPMDAPISGLYMSPSVPEGGLTPAHSNGWRKIWGAENYDPDPVSAKAYFMGAVASYDGYVYWGTINFPLVSFLNHMMVYGPTEPVDIIKAFLGSFRNISIFRAKISDTDPPNPTIEVVNGLNFLPVYSKATGWILKPNNTGTVQYGVSGFGNIFNAYTWTMAAYNAQLYVGTMDWSYMLYDVGKMLIEQLLSDCEDCQKEIIEFLRSFLQEDTLANGVEPILEKFFGGDLWRFPRSDMHALPESLNGLGNCANHGLRNMLVDDGLYVGTGNFTNLLADATVAPSGGWELVRLTELSVEVTADKLSIPADGVSSATIVASATFGNGIPVPDGTLLTFITDHGSFASLSVTKPTVNGVATATLTSEQGSDIVIATIVARVGAVEDAVAVFFIPPGGPGVQEIKTAALTGSGTTKNTATGIGQVDITSSTPFVTRYVTTARYSSNACSDTLGKVSHYWDLHLNSVICLTEVKVRFCPAQNSGQVYYCDGSGWKQCSSQAYADGCIVVTINSSTMPDLNDLSGLPFALVTQTSATPVPAASDFGLILMSLFVVSLGLWGLRRRGWRNPLC
jgi:hypothetical protein